MEIANPSKIYNLRWFFFLEMTIIDSEEVFIPCDTILKEILLSNAKVPNL